MRKSGKTPAAAAAIPASPFQQAALESAGDEQPSKRVKQEHQPLLQLPADSRATLDPLGGGQQAEAGISPAEPSAPAAAAAASVSQVRIYLTTTAARYLCRGIKYRVQFERIPHLPAVYDPRVYTTLRYMCNGHSPVYFLSPCLTASKKNWPLQRPFQHAARLRGCVLCAQAGADKQGPALTPAGVKREASEAFQGGEPEHPPSSQAPAVTGPEATGPEATGSAVTGPADEEGLAEFSRMLSVFTHCGRLKVMAQLLRPSNQHSSSILSSIEFDRDSEVLFLHILLLADLLV